MRSPQRYLGFIVVLVLGLALVLAPGFTRAARAASEDVAMFYDELSQHGEWVEYENYGPVWHPGQVEEDWRPYTNGRWTPTDDGYVFETEEPWGWATYHYGNWMPTAGYGWVWVPGRTWYPSTVEWRTSPEDTPVDTSYVGWAPIPPPNYVPPPAYAPATGYYPGAPVVDALTAPFWIFARAASFLLGFGQPYAPGYSYNGCGCLAPPAYVPTFFPQTMIVPSYYTPNYYPPVVFGPRRVFSAYSWGPPVSYISRVTNINQTIINKTIVVNSRNINRIHSVVPPSRVLDRHHHLRQIMPPALREGKPLPRSTQIRDIKRAQASLNRPNIIKAPKDVPKITREIPRVKPLPASQIKGVPGASLPGKATQKLTPQMTQQIQKLPPNQRIEPGRRAPIKPVAAGEVKPGVPGKPGEVRPGKPGEVRPGVPGKPAEIRPGVPVKPGEVRPGVPGKPAEVRPGKPGEVRPGAPRKPAEVRPGVPVKPGEVRPGVPGKPAEVRPGKPGEVRPGAPPKPGEVRPGVPRGGPAQQQQQLQQQRQREQQLQQQRQREQQQRQQQLQQQRQRDQQQQRLQQQRQQQTLQQQRQREQQQQQQRQREQQMQQQRLQQQRQQQQRQQQQRQQQRMQQQQQQQQQRQQQLQQQRQQQQQQQQQKKKQQEQQPR